MKKFALRLAVGLLAFAAGVTSSAILVLPHTHERPPLPGVTAQSVEDEIRGAVFRHQIQARSDGPGTAYFLSSYNFADPPDSVMKYLTANQLTVRRLSEITNWDWPNPNSARVFVRTGKLRWLSEDEVLVGGSCRIWSHLEEAYIYKVILEDGHWKVKSSEAIG
jgi:hypothetical protein